MGARVPANLVPGLRPAKEPQQGREGGLSGGVQQVTTPEAHLWTQDPSPQSWDIETLTVQRSVAKWDFPKGVPQNPYFNLLRNEFEKHHLDT